MVSSLLPCLLAGAPYNGLAKEREGAPFFFPLCSWLFYYIFPSFLMAVLTHQTLEQALADHQGHPNAICRHPDPSVPAGLQAESLGSFIVQPAQGVMRVAAGTPCTHEYVRYEV